MRSASVGRVLPRGRAERSGFSLIELMMTLVIFGLVATVLFTVLSRQQRFYASAADVVEMRSQIRQGASALPMDLRMIFPRGGDIYHWSDSALDFRSVTGSSVACLRPTTTTLVLPPRSLSKGHNLTTWMTMPLVGDSVLIYDDGPDIGNADDVWRAYGISNVVTVTGVGACPATSGYTTVDDVLQPSFQLTLGAAMPNTIIPGAPMRLFRRVRYSFYEEADAQWYLGASECNRTWSPQCTDLVPISGPYLPYSETAGASGLRFTYLATDGTALTPGTDPVGRIARIQVALRGQTRGARNLKGGHTAQQDSLTLTVGLRNRN